jgi:hypothetical protein
MKRVQGGESRAISVNGENRSKAEIFAAARGADEGIAN